MTDPLIWAARHGRWVLAGGLMVPFVLPGLAAWMLGWLVPLIIGIMFLGALRLAPEDLPEIWAQPLRALGAVLVLQVALPLLWLAGAMVLGLGGHVAVQVVGLMLAAPAIVSSPNIAAMLGLSNAFALRLVIWGSLAVPVTCLPILLLIFGGVDVAAVLGAAGRLAAIIVLAGGAGLLARRCALAGIGATGVARLDGLSVIALAVFVVALMPAFRSTLLADPRAMLGWVALAFGINFGLQLAGLWWARGRDDARTGTLALISGNRNLALFFAALPMAVTAPFLPFLAAYQVPMYLTPLLLGELYGLVRKPGTAA